MTVPLLSRAPEARHAAPARGRHAGLGASWSDRLAGSDPGLNRMRSALQSVATIGTILAVEWAFVHATHALRLPGSGPQVAFANHAYTVIAMLLGAIVGMMTSFGVMDATAKGQLQSMLLLPFPMVAALAGGIAIGGHRVVALVSLAVVLAIGTYLRRFGPRGFLVGQLLFMGDFFGFFLHGQVTMSDLGWLTAEIAVGLATAIVVRFTLFYPRPAKALLRTERSYSARARTVTALALSVFNEPGHDDRRLKRHLLRLNETALMIDAQLEGPSAQRLHQRLFDVELALTNVARFAAAMSTMPLPDDQRAEIRLALTGIVNRDAAGTKAHAASLAELVRDSHAHRTQLVVVHRFAVSINALADAMANWRDLGMDVAHDASSFTPSVMLFAGWLPGSTGVSAVASSEPGRRRGDRAALAPYTRAAIQMGVAVGAAIALGDVLSGRRFYWAVIAAFITFMGANNSGEQVRKAGFRVIGTVVGIALGSLIVQVVGDHTYVSLAVVLAALFFAFYLMRINYAFMTIGITVMVSQLYVQLDEFSNSLLLLRLEETAIGAGVAVLTVVLVFPLRTRRVLRVALREYVVALSTMVDHAADRLQNGAQVDLRADARSLDATYQAVIATVVPLRRSLGGGIDEKVAAATRVVAASRHYARNLVVDASSSEQLDSLACQAISEGRTVLSESLALVTTSLNGPRDGTYVRSASLFDDAERALHRRVGEIGHAQLALRDLALIDGSIAALAQVIGLTVVDLDTCVMAEQQIAHEPRHARRPQRA